MTKLVPLSQGCYYHIYNRGNNREDIFFEEPNYPYFLALYAKYVDLVADTYAYCLLRNHFHLLVRIKTEDEIDPKGPPLRYGNPSGLDPSQSFGNLFNAYSKAINKRYGRTGSLFQHPFGRIPITSDEYFVSLVHYIHLNPQKHGFVRDFREYPYSSFRTICSPGATRIKRDQVLAWFGGRELFERSHQEQFIEQRIAKLLGED